MILQVGTTWSACFLCTHTFRELTSAFESEKSSSLYFEFILTMLVILKKRHVFVLKEVYECHFIYIFYVEET